MADYRAPGDGSGTPPSPRRAQPDAPGESALLLAESIPHALVETKTLTQAEAISVVRTAAEVKIEVAAENEESKGRMQSLDSLSGMERSFSAGVRAEGPPELHAVDP